MERAERRPNIIFRIIARERVNAQFFFFFFVSVKMRMRFTVDVRVVSFCVDACLCGNFMEISIFRYCCGTALLHCSDISKSLFCKKSIGYMNNLNNY